MAEIHVWPERIQEEGPNAIVSVRVEVPKSDHQILWYRIPLEHKSELTESCDPFVIGLLFNAMRKPADLVVHGQVSPSLLQNLEEFQAAWVAWRPDRYQFVRILADEEKETVPNRSSPALMAFSGGVDSCFTAFRHRTHNRFRWKQDLRTGVLVHGFDIPLRLQDDFNSAFKKAEVMLKSLGMNLIPVATNLKRMINDWQDAYINILASCLTLFSSTYHTGMIPASLCYKYLEFPYGSNPITDPLLSSESFRVIQDGAAFCRFAKVKEIAGWTEAMQNLRVCLVGPKKDRNCCECEKCIRTILSFRSHGLELPPCFEHDVRISQILKIRHITGQETYKLIVSKMESINKSETWVKALRIAIMKNKMEQFIMRIPMHRWIRSKFV